METILLMYGFVKANVPNLYVKNDGTYKAVLSRGVLYLVKYTPTHNRHLWSKTINSKAKLLIEMEANHKQ